MAELTSARFAGGRIEALLLQQIGTPGLADAARESQIAAVAERIAGFIAAARTSLDIAVYDLRLDGAPGDRIEAALRDRAGAGVAIRIIHDPTTATAADPAAGPAPGVATIGATPKPAGAEAYLARLAKSADIKAVSGFNALMHNKYIIRDGMTADAAVLTGSTNFTNDAWGLQENNIVTVAAQDLATFYVTDFTELWARGKITESTGYHDTGTVSVAAARVTVAFTPGESATVVRDVVHAIESAKSRIVIAAMVMSSGPILAAISEAMDRGLSVSGLYDGPQMDTVLAQWKAAGIAADKAALWRKVASRLARKNSIPYAPDTPHNFMHLKVIVADDVLITGSYNFSNHARGNAENVLLVEDEAAANFYAGWIEQTCGRYRAA